MSTTHEHTINVALGGVLGDVRPHIWHVVSEQQGQLRGGGGSDNLPASAGLDALECDTDWLPAEPSGLSDSRLGCGEWGQVGV